MSGYKIGDKVRVLHSDYPETLDEDDIAKVVGVEEVGAYLSPLNETRRLYFYNREIEPYTEPNTHPKTLTAALDASAVHDELDSIIAKLERISELRAELGLVNGSTGAQHD